MSMILSDWESLIEKNDGRYKGKVTMLIGKARMQIVSAIAVGQALIPIASYAADNYQIVNSSSLSGSVNVSGGNTLVLDVRNGPLNLSGNLSNAGTIYVVSTNPSVTHASISANNISNLQGAVLTTVLPSSGLPGITSAVSGLSLSLTAVNSIINQGTISSASSLSLVAANIVNSGTMLAQSGTLSATMASLTNSGLIQALQGSVLFKSMPGGSLHIDNTGGNILASNNIIMKTIGSITNTNDQSVSQALLDITGGSLQAQQVLFSNPGGKVMVNVDHIAAPVSSTGADVEISANQGGLQISSLNTSGKTTLAAAGDVDLSGLFSSSKTLSNGGNDFTVFSGRNITAANAPSGASIDATGNLSSGKIEFHAGTTFARQGDLFTVTGSSTPGGNVNLSNVSLRTANNSVVIAALSGTDASGSVNLSNCIVAQNNPSQLGTIDISASGSVVTGNLQNGAGSVKVSTDQSLVIADNQSIQAHWGDVAIRSGQDLSLGVASQIGAIGGNVTLTGNNVTLGINDTIIAGTTAERTGGNVLISANNGVSSGGSNSLSATNGSLIINAKNADISTGSGDSLYAAYGSVALSSVQGSISLGSGTTINTFVGGISLIANQGGVDTARNCAVETLGGNLNLTAGRDVNIGSSGVLNSAVFNGFGGDIGLSSRNGSIHLDTNTNMQSSGGNMSVYAPTGKLVTADTVSIGSTSLGGGGGNTAIGACAIEAGDNNDFYGQNSLQITAFGSGITTGVNTHMEAQGSVVLRADQGTVTLGERNYIAALGQVTVTDINHAITQQYFLSAADVASNTMADTNVASPSQQNSLNAETPVYSPTSTVGAVSVTTNYPLTNIYGPSLSIPEVKSATDSSSSGDLTEKTSSPEVPVAFVQHVRDLQPVSGWDSEADTEPAVSFLTDDNEFIVRTTSDASFGLTGNGTYTLASGTVLLNCKHDVTVRCNEAEVALHAGTIAMLSVTNDVLTLRNLSDNHKGSMTVSLQRLVLPVSPAGEVSIVNACRTSDPQTLVLSDNIARRNLKIHTTPDHHIVSSEFSLMQALATHTLLQDVRHSKSELERRVMLKTLKTAAALSMVVDKARGPYNLHASAMRNPHGKENTVAF